MNKLFAGIFSLSLLCGCNAKEVSDVSTQQSSEAIKVKTMLVVKQVKEFRLTYNGTVVPSVKVPLSFLLPGTVVRLHADVGDFVKKGQVLAELDPTTYENAYHSALALQSQAQDAYNRLKKVHDKGSLPEIQWEEMKSKLEQANSSAAIAGKNLSNCTITAPTDGVIGSKSLEPGSNVVPGFSIFDLVTISDVYVRISVPENEINRIKKNQTASISIPALGSSPFHGKVEKIGVLANKLSKTYEVKVRVHNPDLKIKPGMVCDLELSIEDQEAALTIPYKAVIKDKDGFNYVFLTTPQTKTAIKKQIQLGRFINNQVEVVSGLSKGDILIISGQHKIKDGSKLSF